MPPSCSINDNKWPISIFAAAKGPSKSCGGLAAWPDGFNFFSLRSRVDIERERERERDE